MAHENTLEYVYIVQKYKNGELIFTTDYIAYSDADAINKAKEYAEENCELKLYLKAYPEDVPIEM